MPKYAVIDNDIIVNVIVADDLDIAQEVTKRLCIEYTDDNPATISGDYFNGKLYIPQPYPEWTRDEENGIWVAPEGWVDPEELLDPDIIQE